MKDRSEYFAAGEAWPVDMLDSWRWLIGPGAFSVVRVTAMGSLFVADAPGVVHFLDTTEGSFRRVADSREALDALFDSTDNRRGLLWSFFVRELRNSGPALAPGQCYGWKVPPCLGGEADFKNVEPTDVATHVSIQGQLHEQARGMAPGTRVEEVRVVAPKQGFFSRLFGRPPVA
jgi:hypothetical protein